MSSKDTITKEYMSKRPYFADAFNSCVFDGKQVVKADELMLQEKDPVELGIAFTNGEKDVVLNEVDDYHLHLIIRQRLRILVNLRLIWEKQ